MKTLHLIVREDMKDRLSYILLVQKAEEMGVVVNTIVPGDDASGLELGSSDALYRIATDENSKALQKELINDEVSTFYANAAVCLEQPDNVTEAPRIHEAKGLPVIPTVYSKEDVEKLGDFPIILKTPNSMHGEGVFLMDSQEELDAKIQECEDDGVEFVLRKFVAHKEQARLIVLGDEVIASHANLVTEGFKSNALAEEERKREPKEYSQEIKDVAVKSVTSLGLHFGGVDILFENETGNAYLAEVNMPCYYPTTQELSGVDIAQKMIEYLVK